MKETKKRECHFGGCHRPATYWMVTASGSFYRCCKVCRDMLKHDQVLGAFFKIIERG